MQLKDKKKAVLLAALVAGLMIYWLPGLFRGQKAPEKAAAGKKEDKRRPPSAIRVDVELLGQKRDPYTATKNIFTPVYRKPALVKPSAAPPVTVTPAAPLPPPPPPRPQAEIDADNAREELKKARVLGFVKRKNKTSVLLSLGGQSFVASKGDDITGTYFLSDVQGDTVILGDRKTGVAVKITTRIEEKTVRTVPSGAVGASGLSLEELHGAAGYRPSPIQPGEAAQGAAQRQPTAPPAAPPPLQGRSIRM